jgi:phage-related protein
MKGIKFGNYHSYYEWGLILSEKEISSPEPKTYHVEVEGSDSVLDYTDYFGEVKYKNRTLSFKFAKMNIVPDGFLALYSLVQDTIQGKKMQIILDDDPAYYYVGRVQINEWKSSRGLGDIVIECDCEPYKYKIEETVVAKAVTGSATITLANSRKKVVPLITTDAQFTIAFDGYSGTFNAGTFTIPELELVEGNNIINVTGTGNISFVYREGRL